MNTQTTIEHLYIEIPNFKDQATTSFHDFIKNVNKQLVFITNSYQVKLKTIYLANKSKQILSITFLEQLLILINTFIITVEQYNFECTIDNTNLTTLQLLTKFKVNRLVWKIITFQNQSNNNYQQQSINIINAAINLKFTNFSIDLKYNLPQQTIFNINNDLQICMQLHAPHISYDSYNQDQNLNIKKNINNFLKKQKYDNYEYYSYTNNINSQSKYIIGYCLLENYYGIGNNAVSYLKSKYQTITINNSKQKIKVLSTNEILMLKLTQGLLLKKGIPINNIDNFWQQPIINKLINNKQIKITKNYLSCTNKSWLLLNDLIIDIITNTTI